MICIMHTEFNLFRATRRRPLQASQDPAALGQRLAYNVPPFRPLRPDTHRTMREPAGTAKGFHPVETVISRITAPMHGSNCPSQPLILNP